MDDIGRRIKTADNIAIFTHENPDGDAVGSVTALSTALINMGKKVAAFLEAKPLRHEFILENKPYIKTYEEIDSSKEYEMIIVLDAGDKERIGEKAIEVFDKAQMKIVIDHHITNIGYANFNYVDGEASSTGELIYNLLKVMEVNITKEIASALYLSIISDTGMFRHQNTTKRTFEVAGALLDLGVNITEISRKLYYESSFDKTKCLGNVLSTLTTYLNGKVGILYMTHENFKQFDLEEQDLDGMVDYARNIKGAELGIFIKPGIDGIYKVSLRSNVYFDVAKFAQEFGGGGHKRASGCKFVNKTIDEVIETLLEKLKKMGL